MQRMNSIICTLKNLEKSVEGVNEMDEGKKAMVLFAIETLRKINVECEISMAMDKENESLWFFETEAYLESGVFKGFSVPLKELVRDPQDLV